MPVVAQRNKRATVKRLIVDSIRTRDLALIARQSATLSSANKDTISLEFGGKWRTEVS